MISLSLQKDSRIEDKIIKDIRDLCRLKKKMMELKTE